MSEPISRLRHRAVGARERRFVRPPRRVPFKDGSLLALLYAVVFIALVTGAGLAAHVTDPASPSGLLRIASGLLLTGFVVFGMHLLLSLLSPDALRRNSRVCMALLISLLDVGAAALLVAGTRAGARFADWSFCAPFLIPYGLTPALGTLLLDPAAGFALGLGTSLLMALLAHREQALLVLLLGLAAAVLMPKLMHRRVRRRTQLVRVSLVTALALTASVLLHAMVQTAPLNVPPLLEGLQVSPYLVQFVACLLSGLVSAVVAAALLPVLEHVFGATSNIGLYSFADLSHPLLERLATEAPGTYTHSLMMATLSAAAAERIGANPLLARVGSYYHDIGKLSTPALFIENTTSERNPHRTLKPSTSASWVRSHIKDGVVLAQRYRLPPPISAIVWEHHGTTTMAVFLHKAREQARTEAQKLGPAGRRQEVDESLFRYPGPRPRSRESGIVMLADSVEAAARSLEKPTPAALDSLVNGIVETKLKDGQLDDCPLSLRDLAQVRRSFVTTLATILHARIPYPTPDDTDAHPESREPADAPQS